MDKLFDINYINMNTPNLDDLKVKLKKVKYKGVGIFATKPIKEDELIAFYKVLVIKDNTGYKSPTNMAYAISIMTKADKPSKVFFGDLFLGSLLPPCDNIPFWGYFSNEPSGDQYANCYIDTNIDGNYSNRKVLRAGDTFIYGLRANYDIDAGEEITWCYGPDYERDYVPACE